jgi:nucleoid-associated protein YgaU
MFARIALLVALAVVVWTVAARPSGAHGDPQQYRVRAYDTLWTIASAHYGGDVRAAIDRIERANHLRRPTIHAGETLVLP